MNLSLLQCQQQRQLSEWLWDFATGRSWCIGVGKTFTGLSERDCWNPEGCTDCFFGNKNALCWWNAFLCTAWLATLLGRLRLCCHLWLCWCSQGKQYLLAESNCLQEKQCGTSKPSTDVVHDTSLCCWCCVNLDSRLCGRVVCTMLCTTLVSWEWCPLVCMRYVTELWICSQKAGFFHHWKLTELKNQFCP